MNALNIVRIVMKVADRLRPGDAWQASHKVDGKPTAVRPRVLAFDCGTKDGDPWLEFFFEEQDQDGNWNQHKLFGLFSPSNSGEEVWFNDQQVGDDDVVVSQRVRGFHIRGVIEFEFEFEGHTHRFRFDATIANLV